MARNDLILIDSILEERISNNIPSNQKDEAFEYLAYEQVLKEYDLSYDEILSGSVDGRNDGGIDAIYIFVNGHLITDIKTTFWPKTAGELDVYIFTCKHRDSFKQEPVNSILASLEELLDFSIVSANLSGEYNSEVLEKRRLILETYKKMATILITFNIRIIYACRGNIDELGENIKARGKQIESMCNDYFSGCVSEFQFWGNRELLNAYRKSADYSLCLNFQESFTHGEQYVVLVNLNDYYNFITNGEGKLRKYLFDSNVRDFMGLNAVNQDILDTLDKTNCSTDFWWLNNGVTILSTSATIVGKSITINNVQIVNGLQTSECIFRHFHNNQYNDTRYVLIKILTSNDSQIRDNIIRATNNQTKVETSSLKATDKVQRDIEDILEKSGLYYERRINFYANQGIPVEKIFSPLYLAAGYTALVLKLPHQATALKNRFMRVSEKYDKIFSSDNELELWPVIAKIMRKTDKRMEELRPRRNMNIENYLKSVRYTVSLLTVARILGKINFSNRELIDLDLNLYTDEAIAKTWNDIQDYLPEVWNKSNWKKRNFTFGIIDATVKKWGVNGYEAIVHREEHVFNERRKSKVVISEEMILKVMEMLPVQPWPKGIHKDIAQKLSVTDKEVIVAINNLMKRGLVHKQKNGKVYDELGNVIAERK